MLLPLLTASLALGNLVAGHFLLNYPATLGFDDDIEGTSPCGGFPVVFNANVTKIPVGGFPIELRSTHPQANWLFRATLDQKEPFNWTNLLPVVDQTGLGDFCIPDFVAPTSFVGHTGLIQITQDAVDGSLYQCAAVNFVTGTNSSVGSACNNVTGLTATITGQNGFANSSTSPSTTMSMSGSASGTTATATASPKSLATPTTNVGYLSGFLAGLTLLYTTMAGW